MSNLPPVGRFTPTLKTRRVVTGHDAAGRSIILSDADCRISVAIWHDDFVVTDAWRVPGLPADNSTFAEPCTGMELEGSPSGNVVRIVQFPPDGDYLDGIDVTGGFGELGSTGSAAEAGYAGAPHPLMHRTSTVDYIIVISGEVYAVMEDGEVLLRQGDVLIQRGTNHAWSNRSDKPCLIAAILNGALPLDLD
jgi:mannose-6-phosphate isomerase-like protein (cupin superfamily)